MNHLFELIRKGGPAMIAIIVLSVVLYSRCFKLLLSLHLSRHRAPPDARSAWLPAADVIELQQEVRDLFRHQRIALGAMIAAAPLLGLLGTVNGMTKTFESLAEKSGDKSMEGLARGISEVLVATESGLLVALPALLLVWVAHRGMLRRIRQLNQMERSTKGVCS